MKADIFWTAARVQTQCDAWREELMPLASTELERRLIDSTTAMLAAVGQLQEAVVVNRTSSEAARDLAQEVSAHLKTGISALTLRIEVLEK